MSMKHLLLEMRYFICSVRLLWCAHVNSTFNLRSRWMLPPTEKVNVCEVHF